MIRTGFAALSLILALPALAQETRSLAPDAKPPRAEIAQLAWLAGTWRGEGLGASATEVYSSPQAGRIAGHFQLEDGKGGIAFYELMQIVPLGDSLAYRLRHFNPDLSGWEDKTSKPVEFRLVAIEPDAVYFDGMTLKRSGANQMTVWVRIGEKDGSSQEAPFRYKRAAP